MRCKEIQGIYSNMAIAERKWIFQKSPTTEQLTNFVKKNITVSNWWEALHRSVSIKFYLIGSIDLAFGSKTL